MSETFTYDEHEPQENGLLFGTRHPALSPLGTGCTVTVVDHWHLKAEQVELRVQKTDFYQRTNYNWSNPCSNVVLELQKTNLATSRRMQCRDGSMPRIGSLFRVELDCPLTSRQCRRRAFQFPWRWTFCHRLGTKRVRLQGDRVLTVSIEFHLW